MPCQFAPADTSALPLFVVEPDQVETWLESQPDHIRSWVTAHAFKAEIGAALMLPGASGTPSGAVIGIGTAAMRLRHRFAMAPGFAKLNAGTYRLTGDIDPVTLAQECLGLLLTEYRFTRYSGTPGPIRTIMAPDGINADKITHMAQAESLTRDLINTPAADMGPSQLEKAARDLAQSFGANIRVVTGDDLLTQNFPMIHAVGRAAADAPRLIDMSWGTSGPTLTLVGKGVCFDTGGLNLKPGASMGLMKKDMGGAANVLGLAQLIMAQALPVQLRVLIPAVENSVSGNSFRPQDILNSRKGLTVEINNTDAEGRLVLADALALADETPPDLMISMATLTGAARVAVGPDLAPFFATTDGLADALANAAPQVADPVWRLPYHAPYETMIEPGIADLDNAPAGGMAGAITAALFLRRFVTETANYAHFDIYGWQRNPAPACPKGGLGQGTRAIFEALPKALGL